MAAKYLVYAGCDSEGQVLQGQPYDGPLDSASVADFARQTLRGSIYGMSNTAWGLDSLDWQDLDNASGDGDDEPFYIAIDESSECQDIDGECSETDCQCPFDEYFVSITRNIEGK